MGVLGDVPEPLEDFALMLGGGEAMEGPPRERPDAVVFGTVVRAAPIQKGGELVRLDWSSKEITSKVSMRPRDPTIGEDPDPRGNARGCRGVRWHDGEILATTYHTIERYNDALERVGAVNGGLMAGLHEIDITDRNSVWVSATALEAAVEYDLATGEQLQTLWPREMASFQDALGVEPLPIDKSADNRLQFLAADDSKTESHLHLNAVEEYAGDLYALCNSQAVVLNLTQERVCLQHPHLQGAHNLIIEEGVAIINDTYGRAVQFFDLTTGERIREIDLTQFRWVRRHMRWQTPRYWGRRVAAKLGVTEDVVARPLFVRGLTTWRDYLFVGVSPAAVLQINRTTGALVDAYRYSSDVRVCVHGLDTIENVT